MAKQAVWLSGLVSYEQAATILAEGGGVSISASRVWQRVPGWGAACQAVEEQRRQEAAAPDLSRAERQAQQQAAGGHKGVAMDGGMVHIRDEGWKELKVGCVFDVQPQSVRDKESGHWLSVPRAVQTRYVAHLGQPQTLGDLVWAEARGHDWLAASQTQVLGDGAPWIWRLADALFPTSRQVVDWYHATDHLANVTTLLYPDALAQRQQWFQEQSDSLFGGQALAVADTIERLAADRPPAVADKLLVEAGYFHQNADRMQYEQVRQAGFCIGSGVVESGCKPYKARLTGPGMRWSREGLERLLPIRSAIMSDRFDDLWARAYALPPN